MLPTAGLVVEGIVFADRLIILLNVIPPPPQRLVCHTSEYIVGCKPRGIPDQSASFLSGPVHKLMGAEMAVATKLYNTSWPHFMQVAYDALENAGHVERLVATARTQEGKYHPAAVSFIDE